MRALLIVAVLLVPAYAAAQSGAQEIAGRAAFCSKATKAQNGNWVTGTQLEIVSGDCKGSTVAPGTVSKNAVRLCGEFVWDLIERVCGRRP